MAIAVKMSFCFILRINLQTRRASKISVNFHCSCKGHFKHLFNKLPPNIFKTQFIASVRYFIIYFCMYKILSKTPLEGDEKKLLFKIKIM